MHTAYSSSHPRGVSTRHPSLSVMAFWYAGFLVWWPSGVVAFWCGGLLVWCPSGVMPSVMAFCPPEDHTRRLPNQKAITEGHNRRPQQKAITEGHTPQNKAPHRSRPPETRPPQEQTPWDQAPPRRRPPAARHDGIPPAMHAGIVPPL